MSPTLLELLVAILLLWVAWRIGAMIAPRLIASFISFWRNGKPPPDFSPRASEKNITPSADPGGIPRQNYAPPRE